MNQDFYNELQFLYVSLTERFLKYTDYTYDGFYKCYNENYFFLRDEKKVFLQKLSEMSLKEIYSEKYKNETVFSEDYLDSKLIKFCENRICIIDGLGQITFYYILSLLQDELDAFINTIEQVKSIPNGFITSDEHRIYFAYTEFFERWVKQFEGNEKMKMLIHLFTKTNSNIITINFNGKIEINESKIKDMKSRLEYFDFSKLV
ncbi:hypothetical protein [Chryseobacterium koreense]|uniref:hypothetical protein n=1 Tax=Chryseobacterium koreense TaxID=232216 RepID=UPI0026EE0EC9|nr:hypothetical protein [Chryseobacterium koreense]